MPPPGPSTLANRDKQNTTNIATDHKIKSSVPVHRDAVLAVDSTTRVEHELHSEPHNVVEIFTVAELRTLLQDPRKASKAAAAAATGLLPQQTMEQPPCQMLQSGLLNRYCRLLSCLWTHILLAS
jgi:hypothetical protein